MTAMRVFVCDDDAPFRALVRFAIEDEPDLELAGEAADGEAGVAGVAAARPDVVLVDLTMPRVDGLEAIPRMRRAAPDARIVAMSGHGPDHMEAPARRAGATAYVEKGGDLDALLAVLREQGAAARRAG